MTDSAGGRVLSIGTDGKVTTIVGLGSDSACTPDNSSADEAKLGEAEGIAVSPDGSLIVADRFNSVLRRIAPSLPGLASATEVSVPAADGSELYVFDSSGRHLRTLDALTGQTLLTFNYAQFGYDRLLGSIHDHRSGKDVQIYRYASGVANQIHSPNGYVTALSAPAGLLTQVTQPDLTIYVAAYDSGSSGLLVSLNDPNSHLHQFQYDGAGLLWKDWDPETPSSGTPFKELTSTPVLYGNKVESKSYSGRKYTYTSLHKPDHSVVRTIAAPDLLQTSITSKAGTQTVVLPDTTLISTTDKRDIRFGGRTPLKESVLELPSGRTLGVTHEQSAVPALLADPLAYTSVTTTTTLIGNDVPQNTTDQVSGTATYTRATNANTVSLTTPAGRKWKVTLDDFSRITKIELDYASKEFAALNVLYDAEGRLDQVTQNGRMIDLTYDPTHGYVSLATVSGQTPVPLSRAISYNGHDPMGRVTQMTLPDGHAVGLGYDAVGLPSSVTPPGRPDHVLTHNGVGLLDGYAPPAVPGVTDKDSSWAWDKDRLPGLMTRADGKTALPVFDPVTGRLTALNSSDGSIIPGYDSVGRLETLATSAGIMTTIGYDGPVVTSVSTGQWTVGLERDALLRTRTGFAVVNAAIHA